MGKGESYVIWLGYKYPPEMIADLSVWHEIYKDTILTFNTGRGIHNIKILIWKFSVNQLQLIKMLIHNQRSIGRPKYQRSNGNKVHKEVQNTSTTTRVATLREYINKASICGSSKESLATSNMFPPSIFYFPPRKSQRITIAISLKLIIHNLYKAHNKILPTPKCIT